MFDCIYIVIYDIDGGRICRASQAQFNPNQVPQLNQQGRLPSTTSNAIRRGQSHIFKNSDSSCLDYEQEQHIDSNPSTQAMPSIKYEQYRDCVHANYNR